MRRCCSNSANSGWRARKSSACPSSSPRAKVQVEYTSRPPDRTRRAAASRISRWRAMQRATFSSLHSPMASGSLRNIPSPEQGASTNTLSKKAGSVSASSSAEALTTAQFLTPMRSTFCERIFARPDTYSLAMSTPSPAIAAASCVVLPPGAAQRSRTRSLGCTLRRGAAHIAEGS